MIAGEKEVACFPEGIAAPFFSAFSDSSAAPFLERGPQKLDGAPRLLGREGRLPIWCRERLVVAALHGSELQETALANMDLLHVGLGSTRWGGAAGNPETSAPPEPETEIVKQSGLDNAAPAYLEQIGVGSVMNRVHLSVEVSTGKQQTVLTNALELRQRRTAVTAARFDIAAQPRNGAANKALCSHLATALGVKSGDVSVASGHKVREKVIAVEGLPLSEVEKRLLDTA